MERWFVGMRRARCGSFHWCDVGEFTIDDILDCQVRKFVAVAMEGSKSSRGLENFDGTAGGK